MNDRIGLRRSNGFPSGCAEPYFRWFIASMNIFIGCIPTFIDKNIFGLQRA